MTFTARALVVALGLILLMIVVRGLRRQRLRYEVAIPWLVLGGALVVLAVFQPWADRLARLAGIDYPPSFYVLIGLFVVLVLLFQLSLRISRLGEDVKTLVQELAVVRADDATRDATPNEPVARTAHPNDATGRAAPRNDAAGRTANPNDGLAHGAADGKGHA